MELTLNLVWLVVATVGVACALRAPKRSARVLLAVLCAAALLFPIISASDDLNANRTLTDAAAAVITMIVLLVTFVAIARVRVQSQGACAADVATSSDPRSPPAR